jgi:large subunit ribosomal protein L6
MSRIGKRPIELPSTVNVAISPGRVQVNGPLGELSQIVPQRMKIEQNELRGTDLELNVGYSHSVVIKPRPGITFEVPVPTQVVVKGTDKQQVGQTAAEVRQVRPPEPYKGKGIRYRDEYVRRKVGKRA